MGEEGYQEKARRIVFEYVKKKLDVTDTYVEFGVEDVYVVWFCKTLQNWKCLISTMLPDQMYYELTYDGDKQRTYIDSYKKFDNVTVLDDNSRGELPDEGRGGYSTQAYR